MSHTNKEDEIVVGFAVNPELVVSYDSGVSDVKLRLEKLSVQLSGSSGDVAVGCMRLGRQARLVGFTGFETSVIDGLLENALKDFCLPFRRIPILDQTSCAVLPADFSQSSRVIGKRGDVLPELVDAAKRIIDDLDLSPGVMRVATGVRSVEVPLVDHFFGDSQRCVLNPNAFLCQEHADIEVLLPKTRLLILNDYEFDKYFGEKGGNICAFHTFGVRLVIMTTGKTGGVCSLNGDVWQYESIRYDAPAYYDAGAGDWFLAGFLTAIVENEFSLETITREQAEKCITFACHVAGLKVTRPGAANGPYRDEVPVFESVIV